LELEGIFKHLESTQKQNIGFSVPRKVVDTVQKINEGKVSRKLLHAVQSKVFLVRSEKLKGYCFQKFHFGDKLSRLAIRAQCLRVYWFSSAKGLYYYAMLEHAPHTDSLTTKSICVFQSHAFERFMERSLGMRIPRHEVVGRVLWTTFQKDDNKIFINTEGGITCAYLYTAEGLWLGRFCIMSEMPLLVFKTYISRKMFSDWQVASERKAIPWPALSFDIMVSPDARKVI